MKFSTHHAMEEHSNLIILIGRYNLGNIMTHG